MEIVYKTADAPSTSRAVTMEDFCYVLERDKAQILSDDRPARYIVELRRLSLSRSISGPAHQRKRVRANSYVYWLTYNLVIHVWRVQQICTAVFADRVSADRVSADRVSVGGAYTNRA